MPLLADVSLTVRAGETVGLVGESGSGKSLTVRSALGMLPEGRRPSSGRVVVGGTDVLRADPARSSAGCAGPTASMIFQDPRASINPVRRIGDYLVEGLRASGRLPHGSRGPRRSRCSRRWASATRCGR